MMLDLNPGLVTQYQVIVGRLDTESDDAPGYNDLLREPVGVDDNGDGIADLIRAETQVTLYAQISTDTWEKLRMVQGGIAPTTQIELVFDHDDLVTASLIGSGGECLIRTNDRLVSVYDEDGVLLISFDDDPGATDHRPPLKVDQVRPSGFMVSQHLWVVTFSQEDRYAR